MKKPEIILVAGARPNFMKVAPIWKALKRRKNVRTCLVHTGQHYDRGMSAVHFKALGLPRPDIHLNAGSGTQAEQTARVMERMEKVLLNRRPSFVVVVGDVNSTLAAALAAAKLHIPVAHVEAGLRSHDRTMPEEINRILTDSISDVHFTHSREADLELRKEGVEKNKIHFVGNVMIDSLDQTIRKARLLSPLSEKAYGLVTLHRPSNVDDLKRLSRILQALRRLSRTLPLYFPVHPRTARQLKKIRQSSNGDPLHLLPPLSYLEILSAMDRARLVITDSGGIQEETTALGVSCLTLRKTSERMVTVRCGTNRLIGENPDRIIPMAKWALQSRRPKRISRPPKWDGRAAERIARILLKEIQ